MDVEIGATAGLSISSGDLKDSTDSIVGAIGRGSHKPLPIINSKSEEGKSDGTNTVLLNFGFPPVGSMWELTSVVTWGTDAFTVVTGIAGALFQGNPSRTPSSSAILLPGLSFPFFYEFQTGMWVKSQTNVFLLTSSAPSANQRIGGTIYFNEWRISDVSKVRGRVNI